MRINNFIKIKNKRGHILSQLLCIIALFTACTDDEVTNQSDTVPLQINVQTEVSGASRAIIDGGYLPDGSSIGVNLMADDGAAYDGQVFYNLQYTAVGEGAAQIWSSTTPASLSSSIGKVIAYYPYNDDENLDITAVPVETETQTDYMYAKPVTL